MRLTVHASPRQLILQAKHKKSKKYSDAPALPLHHLRERTSPRCPPVLKSQIKNDLVLEDGNEQHDGEPGEHAQVLQDEVSQLAALVVLAVPVKHFRELQTKSQIESW